MRGRLVRLSAWKAVWLELHIKFKQLAARSLGDRQGAGQGCRVDLQGICSGFVGRFGPMVRYGFREFDQHWTVSLIAGLTSEASLSRQSAIWHVK